MGRIIKVTGIIAADDLALDFVDSNDGSGLSERGFEEMHRILGAHLEDLQFEAGEE
jgi:hypothetical protein